MARGEARTCETGEDSSQIILCLARGSLEWALLQSTPGGAISDSQQHEVLLTAPNFSDLNTEGTLVLCAAAMPTTAGLAPVPASRPVSHAASTENASPCNAVVTSWHHLAFAPAGYVNTSSLMPAHLQTAEQRLAKRAIATKLLSFPPGIVPQPLTRRMVSACDACGDEYEVEGNYFVECDKCRVVVHMRCYGLSRTPDGRSWLCDVCRWV